MKIAFVSGVKFGLELLSHILNNGYKISVVFSYEDSKRKSYSDYVSFDEITKKNQITHVKVKNINDLYNVEFLKSIQPDIILVTGWSQLLKKEILEIPKLGVIGTHPTELPKYRGRAPIPWTILKNLQESALTFFYMKDGVDDGDILDQRKFAISEDDDASSLYQKIIDIGKEMILENLHLLEMGKAKRIKQDETKFIEYWPKRTPEDGRINWSKSAKEIHTLIKATTHPYPGAFSYFKNSKLIIWNALLLDEQSKGPGIITSISNGVIVGTGKGSIQVKMVGLNEEKEIPANELFLKEDIGLKLE